jgi:hypothetical protein
MTDQDLRDLLQERVADLTTTDLSASAWREARRLRTRRRSGAVAGVAVGALAVAGIAVLTESGRDPRGDAGPTTSSPSLGEPEGPDALAGDAPVYFSPDPAAEDDLEPAEDAGLLPRNLDLAPDAPAVESHPVTRAVAAIAVTRSRRLDRVVLVTPDGYRTLTLPPGAQPREDMLSADGTSVELPTATYTFATGAWTRHPGASPVWPEVPPQMAGTTPFGAPRWEPATGMAAVAYDFGADVPSAEGSTGHPESIAVTPTLGPPTILSIDWPVDGGRWKRCCPVAGWLDPDTIVYESRSAEPKLIAWRVGTHDFSLVSRVVGLRSDEWYVASFAGLDRDAGSVPTPQVTWAPDVEHLDDVDPGSLGRPVGSGADGGAPPETGIAGGSPAGRAVVAPDGLVAQAWARNPALSVPDLDTFVDGPTYVSVTGDGTVHVLAFASKVGEEVPAAPQVAGWSASGAVVLTYDGATVVWDVANGTLGLGGPA